MYGILKWYFDIVTSNIHLKDRLQYEAVKSMSPYPHLSSAVSEIFHIYEVPRVLKTFLVAVVERMPRLRIRSARCPPSWTVKHITRYGSAAANPDWKDNVIFLHTKKQARLLNLICSPW